jgi:hypothetical protein
MKFDKWTLGRLAVIVAIVATASAFTAQKPARSSLAVPGMTFKVRLSLLHTPTNGRGRRPITLLGHGQFGAGMGRVDIDSIDTPSSFRKGDFIIIRDTMNSFWARPSDFSVRRMNAPLVNPLEGISERLVSGTGSPSSLRVTFDTVSLDETLADMPVRHFRISADAIYPVGNRQVAQKVVIEQWLAKIPVNIVNPFGSRIRGLPDVPVTKGDYRAFINTLAAANRVFGEAVAVKTVTNTSYTYGAGMGEDYNQTVELLDLKQGNIDEKLFQLSAEYGRKPVAADSASRRPPPARKPPVE